MEWIGLGFLTIFAVGVGVWWWRRRQRQKASRLISFVGLLRQPRSIDPIILRTQIRNAWDLDLGIGEEPGPDGFLMSVGPFVHVMTDNGMFMINSFEEPYLKDVEKAADEISEFRLRELFRQHTAWISVDVMGIDGTTDEKTVQQAYRKLGRLFAELLDDDIVLILTPDEMQLFPNVEATHDALCADDPIAALQDTLHAPMVSVSGDDPRMVKAVAEARERWSEFVDRFERQDGENFAVKAPITVDEVTEFIWIEVTSIEGERIYGRLANEPHDLGPLKEGSKVSVKIEDLNDWMYIADKDMKGGFTVKVLSQSLKGK